MARPKKTSVVKEAAAAVEAVKEHVAEKASAKAVAKADVSVILQMGSAEWDISNCEERVTKAIIAAGHKESAIKSLAIYIKPEEGKIYYVANDDVTGSIDL